MKHQERSCSLVARPGAPFVASLLLEVRSQNGSNAQDSVPVRFPFGSRGKRFFSVRRVLHTRTKSPQLGFQIDEFDVVKPVWLTKNPFAQLLKPLRLVILQSGWSSKISGC